MNEARLTLAKLAAKRRRALCEETTLNFTAPPHVAQMQVIERFTRTTPNTLVYLTEIK